ncbi:MAG TPA: hypothetical protein PK802_00320 [Candidatus Cloacimonadota bacterium]|jgi:hypothetical protein|nr:hypothetical protein [Candidatus Cloacimonadota bacterium]HOR58727.1 hypothetical protein [Candidatus Cloacimonadota bacterium]HPB08120.1 hypothetical protein [Candidatus Cloacimonadota bacterium]HQO44117.1 hypothetical protein [Candidatus Cloacimonadota bacterium]HQP17505.1 hypothetical protein [Candidatus Cloacimonadota bacterium]
MTEYDEDRAKKELENLFNELFVSDLKTLIGENYLKSEKLYNQMKGELRELIDVYLLKKVETTIEEINKSNDKALLGVIEQSKTLLDSYKYNFTDLDQTTRKMKLSINLVLLISIISLAISVISMVSG